MKLVNAISFNMVKSFPCSLGAREISVEEAAELITESAVGHPATADLLSVILGKEVKANRCTLTLASGEQVVLAQYIGPRLEEGCTELPEGAVLRFLLVTVECYGSTCDLCMCGKEAPGQMDDCSGCTFNN